MKFSILISSYNKGEYIENCINSCLNQSEKNIEIILFDNESIDESNKILKKYEDRITIVRKKRSTSSPALNQIDLIFSAFKISSGSIICLLDADDYFEVNKLSNIKKIFQNNTNLNSVFDLPILKFNNNKIKFSLKKKFQINIWPTIIPTSGISCRRDFFEFFILNSFSNDFDLLEIDFRFNVVSRNIDKKFEISKDNLTYYRQVDTGVMANIQKFSKKWWKKRHQAHIYMDKLFLKNQKNYKNTLDFFITKTISNLSNYFNDK